MSIVATGNWPNAAEPIIRKNFLLGLKGIPQEREMMFDVGPSSKLTETLLSWGDSPAMGPFTGSLNYGQVVENYSKSITNVEYAIGLALQRKFILTDQIRVAKKLPQIMGKSVRLRWLSDTWALFNNAFNTTYTGGDGLALCSTAHTSNAGGSNWSNSGTSALSPAAVTATRTAMIRFNTNTDQPQFETKPDTLIVPTDLEDYATEIVKSRGKVDTANNNVNFHYGQYQVLATRMLTDTNNWFMANMEKMKENQVWYEVVRLEMEKDKDFNTKVARWSWYSFYGFGFERPDHIYGHQVS